MKNLFKAFGVNYRGYYMYIRMYICTVESSYLRWMCEDIHIHIYILYKNNGLCTYTWVSYTYTFCIPMCIL